MDAIDIVNALETYHQMKREEDYQKGKDRIGILRGGSSGVMYKGKSYGTCPRVALTRTWAAREVDEGSSSRLMWDGGLMIEGVWDTRLKMAMPEYDVLPEGEVLGNWQIPGSDRRVGCTPDATIATKEGEHLARLEYKRISSVWTARTVSLKREPKKSHFIQTCHSMWATNISRYILLYTQDVNYAIPPNTKYKSKESMFDGYNNPLVVYDNDFPLRIEPHISAYDIDVSKDGVFWFKHHLAEHWTPTTVTIGGIMTYFKIVDNQEKNKVLANPPTQMSLWGGTKDSSKECKYCNFKPICDTAPTFDQFKSQVIELGEAPTP